ncbi:hypothetical protein [Sanyastnella coralliicola]|uniref:hypothetical protein n=1 Tax=Sanyastnella coralliicola TaxID=3069118 RepID=UPI0027BA794F|nr:hypothetical protein [Longitalea sp. SCSIO 12813]
MRYTFGKSSFRPFLENGGMAYGYFFGIDMRRGVENTWATGNALKNFRYFERSYVDLFGSFGLEVDFSNERTMFFQPIAHRRIHNNFIEGEMVVYQIGFELGMRKFL